MQGARSLLNVPIGTWVRIRYAVPLVCCTRRPIGRRDHKNRSSVPHQTITDVSVATIAKHCKWLNHFSGCFPGLIAKIMRKHVYNTKNYLIVYLIANNRSHVNTLCLLYQRYVMCTTSDDVSLMTFSACSFLEQGRHFQWERKI